MGVAEGEVNLCQGEAIEAIADVGVAEISTCNIAGIWKLAYQNSGRDSTSAKKAGGNLPVSFYPTHDIEAVMDEAPNYAGKVKRRCAR